MFLPLPLPPSAQYESFFVCSTRIASPVRSSVLKQREARSPMRIVPCAVDVLRELSHQRLVHDVVLNVLPVACAYSAPQEDTRRRTPQRAGPIAASLSSSHGSLKRPNFLFVVSARELLSLEIMLRGGPALVIDRNGVATEVGEASVLTDRFVELDDFRIFVLLRRCSVLVVGVGNEIRVIVGSLEGSGRHVRGRR